MSWFRDNITSKLVKISFYLVLVAGLFSSQLMNGVVRAVESYDNAQISNIALTKLGGYEGQCKVFVNNVVYQASGGTQRTYPGYHSGFQNAGGIQVNAQSATRGDIIQVGNYDGSPKLHTAIIISNLGGGNFNVVDSNWGYDGIVRQHNFNPYSWAPGVDTRIWRMGTIKSNWGGVSGLTFLGKDRIYSGEVVRKGQYLLSNDARFVLTLQNDGNLVLYFKDRALWNSGTSGQNIDRLTMQDDGNLVLYRTDGAAAWHTYTGGRGKSTLVVQGDGNLVLYKDGGVPTWNSGSGMTTEVTYMGKSSLTTNQQLLKGQYLRSPDKRYALLLQSDGNLVLYAPGYRVLWHSRTQIVGSARLILQNDGNLVLYDANSRAHWHTYTGSTRADRLILQSDGNLVLYDSSFKFYWNSSTGGMI